MLPARLQHQHGLLIGSCSQGAQPSVGRGLKVGTLEMTDSGGHCLIQGVCWLQTVLGCIVNRLWIRYAPSTRRI